MTTPITCDFDPPVRRSWTKWLAECFLEQLGSHQRFMDIDVLPGAWVSRGISIRQHWVGEPNASPR